MKFNCNCRRKKTFEEKWLEAKKYLEINRTAFGYEVEQLQTVKHRKFAWFPIRIDDNDCRWLEYIQYSYPDAWIYDYPQMSITLFGNIIYNKFVDKGKRKYFVIEDNKDE